MRFTNRASLDPNSVIASFLAVSRNFLGAGRPPAGGREDVLKPTLDQAAAACGALAALTPASTGRGLPAGNSSTERRSAKRILTDDAQTTHELARLLKRRVAGLFVPYPAETALEW